MNATQWALLAIWPLGMILAGIVPQLAHVGTSLWWVGVGAGVVGGGLAAVDAAHSGMTGPVTGLFGFATLQLIFGLFGAPGNLQVFFPGLGAGLLCSFALVVLVTGNRFDHGHS